MGLDQDTTQEYLFLNAFSSLSLLSLPLSQLQDGTHHKYTRGMISSEVFPVQLSTFSCGHHMTSFSFSWGQVQAKPKGKGKSKIGDGRVEGGRPAPAPNPHILFIQYHILHIH